MRYKSWHTCKVVASAGGLTIGYVDDNPSIWDGNMYVLQPGDEYREPLPEFTDYKIVNDKWVRVEKQNTRKEKRRGHNEGSIFQRWTAKVTINEADTGKPKKITVCGKTQEQLKEKLAGLPGISDISKIPISQSWVAQAITGVNPMTGKPKRITFYGDTRKEVLEKLDSTKHDIKNGTFTEPSKMTFGEWLDIWLNEYAKPVVRSTTYDSYYRWIKNHIIPGLGGINLKELQPAQIQKFYNQKLTEKKKIKAGTLSPRSVRYMHTLIQEALEQALKEGKIIRNPAKATKPPRLVCREVGYLNEEEIINFLNNIADDYWYPAYILALGSGLRLGELMALTWGNIDFQKKTLKVKEAVSRVNTYQPDGPKTKLEFHEPKSKKGKRTIPLPTQVIEELKKFKEKQREFNGGNLININEDKEFIFRWPDGKLIDPSQLSKHFLKLARDNGLENVTFHGLRHSYATALLQAGEHPKVVQELLGDSTISVVLDVYSHVVPGLKEKATGKLEDILAKKKPSLVKEG
jgi:integrase